LISVILLVVAGESPFSATLAISSLAIVGGSALAGISRSRQSVKTGDP